MIQDIFDLGLLGKWVICTSHVKIVNKRPQLILDIKTIALKNKVSCR